MATTVPHRPWWRVMAGVALSAAALVAISATSVPSAARAADTAAVSTQRAPIHMTPELERIIQERVDRYRTSNTIAGVSMAVVTPDPDGSGPVITTFTAGVPSFGSATPVTASTQFELGSETKAFTADLLASLVAAGIVSLDDDLSTYAPPDITVPTWTDPQTGDVTSITLGDLATHQSGLPDVPPNFNEGCAGAQPCINPRPGYTQTMLWAGLQQQDQLLWQPGSRWLYSNWGFALLGTILSNLVEPSQIQNPPALQSVLTGTFLDALGMTDTELETTGPDLATPYLQDGTETFYWDNTNAFSGAGGLISTADDMGAWVAAHLGYFDPASAPAGVQAMPVTLQQVGTVAVECESETQCGPPNFQSGLVWQLYAAGARGVGVPFAYKNGGTSGASSHTVIAASVGVGVTDMMNQGGRDGDSLATEILALLAPVQVDPTPTPPPAPRPLLPATGLDLSGAVLPAVSGVVLIAVGALFLARRTRPRHRVD